MRIRAIRRFGVARTRANAETLTSSAGSDALAARRVADFSTPRGTSRTPGRFFKTQVGIRFFVHTRTQVGIRRFYTFFFR